MKVSILNEHYNVLYRPVSVKRPSKWRTETKLIPIATSQKVGQNSAFVKDPIMNRKLTDYNVMISRIGRKGYKKSRMQRVLLQYINIE